MAETFTARYEKGALLPFRPLDLEEGQIVRLLILPPGIVTEYAASGEKVSIEKDTTQPEEAELAAWDAASKKALEILEQIEPKDPVPQKGTQGKKT